MRDYAKLLERKIDYFNKHRQKEIDDFFSMGKNVSNAKKILAYVEEKTNGLFRFLNRVVDAEKKQYHKECEAQYKKYLSRYNPEKYGVVDVDMKTEDVVSAVHDVMFPIVKTTKKSKIDDGLQIDSHIQYRLGIPNKDEILEGFAYVVDDVSGIKKFYYAKVNRQQFNGITNTHNVFDLGIVDYNGFYRDNKGEYYPINQCNYFQDGIEMGDNVFYESLNNAYEYAISEVGCTNIDLDDEIDCEDDFDDESSLEDK